MQLGPGWVRLLIGVTYAFTPAHVRVPIEFEATFVLCLWAPLVYISKFAHSHVTRSPSQQVHSDLHVVHTFLTD